MYEKKKLFDAVEKINGDTIATKSDLLKVADNLAATSRILRKANAKHEAVLDRLRAIGDAEAAAVTESKRVRAEAQVASIQPALERGRRLLADAKAARVEAKPFVNGFEAVQWPTLFKKFGAHNVVGMESTSTRLSMLQRLVGELHDLAVRGNDSHLQIAIQRAEQLTETDSVQSGYVVRDLQTAIAGDGAGEHIRRVVAAIKKRLVELGEDVNLFDSCADAATEAK
jgi:hypothetical protein